MTSDTQPAPGSPGGSSPRAATAWPLTAGRILIRALTAIAGIIGGLFCYFVCQGMFSGYPRYGTGILSGIGLILIMAAGGACACRKLVPPGHMRRSSPSAWSRVWCRAAGAGLAGGGMIFGLWA
jgi:hypothetical protein